MSDCLSHLKSDLSNLKMDVSHHRLHQLASHRNASIIFESIDKRIKNLEQKVENLSTIIDERITLLRSDICGLRCRMESVEENQNDGEKEIAAWPEVND